MYFLYISNLSFLAVSSTGPSDPCFARFRDAFAQLPTVPPPSCLCVWKWPDEQPPYTLRTARALEVREWAQQQLLRGSFGRDDYRELCELIVVFLGGEVNNVG